LGFKPRKSRDKHLNALLTEKRRSFCRTYRDSPDVDNEVLIDASKHYVKTGEFVMIKIIEATEFDLYGEPV
jgi:tRNA A37 methylthiotransferase MiaB